MKLPVNYNDTHYSERRKVREEYVRVQKGLCYYCKEPLDGNASTEVEEADIDWSLFPENFFDHPIHLHHSHETGMTLGAVHCRCNAYLWQYLGE